MKKGQRQISRYIICGTTADEYRALKKSFVLVATQSGAQIPDVECVFYPSLSDGGKIRQHGRDGGWLINRVSGRGAPPGPH